MIDLNTGESYPINPEEPRSEVKVCRDVLVLKPGTTVLSLFGKRDKTFLNSAGMLTPCLACAEMLLHPPWSLVGGEYIRCEGRPRGGGPKKQLRKDDVLDDDCCVVTMKASRKGLRVKLNLGGGKGS